MPRTPKLFVFLLFIFMVPRLWAVDVTPEACNKGLEDLRTESLRLAVRLENEYRDRDWLYLKYWETLYVPLWDAKARLKDSLSPSRQAEGEVLSGRYEHLSGVYKESADEKTRALNATLAALKANVAAMAGQVCAAGDMQSCLAPRITDLERRLAALEKIFSSQNEQTLLVSAAVTKAALNDKPSDHDAFEDRFFEVFKNRKMRQLPVFLGAVRNFTEKLEVDWPGESCCAYCVRENLHGEADPVFNAVKPDEQGAAGVSGNIVNQARLTKAFEEMEKEKKMR